jgi:prepilin-type N-terminal cleavage/methylation domain-containing protein
MSPARTSLRPAFSLVELLVVLAILAILIALLIPAIQKARAAAASAECSNNLKQIGLALHQYHDANGRFPSWGELQNNWMYKILPYLEQDALYKQGQSTHPDVQAQTWSTIVPTYLCPADPRENAGGLYLWPSEKKKSDPSLVAWRNLGWPPFAMTSYLGVAGQSTEFVWDGATWAQPYAFNGVFRWTAGTKIAEITDGLSSTLMVGERPPAPDNFSSGWALGDQWGTTLWTIVVWPPVSIYPSKNGFDPGPACPEQAYYFSAGDVADYCHANHFWSFHAGGGHWLMCDGSVHFLTYDVGTTSLPLMASINGGEEVPPID